MRHPTYGIAHTSAFVTLVLAGTRNSSMAPPCGIDPKTHRTMSRRSYHGATSRSWEHNEVFVIVLSIKSFFFLLLQCSKTYLFLGIVSESGRARKLRPVYSSANRLSFHVHDVTNKTGLFCDIINKQILQCDVRQWDEYSLVLGKWLF